MEKNKDKMNQCLLALIDRDDREYVKKVTEAFSVSKSSIYNYVKQLADSNILQKNESRKTGYELVKTVFSFTYNTGSRLNEDIVYKEDIDPIVSGFSQNIIHIWYYSFCGMMNNAIEHSGASLITVKVVKDEINTSVIIKDNGEGIFAHIHNYILDTTGEDLPLRECIGFLFPGRFTTDKEKHSGEGIFFTSQMLDRFSIVSDNLCFTRDNFSENKGQNIEESDGGTTVSMTLSNHSVKKTIDVFNRFSDVNEGFYKTSIPMSHLYTNGFPVSRSEARRLVKLIKDFREVVLDFTGIDNIGQAFVHELLIVQKEALSETHIEMINRTPDVEFMIKRQK